MAEFPDDFRLPRFAMLPDVGLYLDQVVKYLNRNLIPLGLPEVTPSMVSNYVKKRYIPAPVRKQYSSDQLAGLMILSIGKNVLMMDDLSLLLKQWASDPRPFPTRYDLYCEDLEQALQAAFAGKAMPPEAPCGELVRSLNIAAAHIILLNRRLKSAAPDDSTVPV